MMSTTFDHHLELSQSSARRQHDHISVCICTYKRPKMLLHLLEQLQNQKTDQLFSYSIVIVDNDYAQSARDTVNTFKNNSIVRIDYCCQPERNIALTRNTAVKNSQGNILALIDDDEFPNSNWLFALYQARERYNADGVLGPVNAHFEEIPPKWVIQGNFYERGEHATGDVLKWQDTRSGNVLMNRAIFDDHENFFRQEFGQAGEDVDFFKRAIDKNYKFVWCNAASVYEAIPPIRCKRTYMLKRALLRGKVTLQYSDCGAAYIAKSIVAVPIYTLALPFSLVIGHHHFMKILTRHVEHLGRIIAFCGLGKR